MDTNTLEIVKNLVAKAETQLAQAKELLNQLTGDESEPPAPAATPIRRSPLSTAGLSISDDGKIVEGVFDGESMVGPDSKKYSVPPNYASKSKLVYGDKLKLIINENGMFTYKQIGPVERKYIRGILSQDGKTYRVLAEGKQYRVLAASVSYYRAQPGDEVAIIVPEDLGSEWATIENLIPRGSGGSTEDSDASSSSESPESTDTSDFDTDNEENGSPFSIPKTLFSRR